MMFSIRVCSCQTFFSELYLNLYLAPLLCLNQVNWVNYTDSLQQEDENSALERVNDGIYRRCSTLILYTTQFINFWKNTFIKI